jgi:hypothetical protein
MQKSTFVKIQLRGFLFLNLLLTLEILNAQTDFRPGYLLKLNGDTLFGMIDYRGDLAMGEICRYKSSINEKEQIYSPNDISGYRFINDKYFISKEVHGKKVFLEFLIKGKISLYYLRDAKGDYYFLEKDSSGIVNIPYIRETRYIDNTSYLYESKEHIGILNFYMKDVPELQSRIANIEQPDHNSLIKLAEDYHHKICKDESCIIYEKKSPLIQFSVEPLAGVTKFIPDFLKLGTVIDYGANIYLKATRTSENLYFKTGIIISSNDTMRIYKLPLQIQYLYPNAKFRPKVSFGINLNFQNFNSKYVQTDLSNSWQFCLGFIYKLANHSYFSANVYTDFYSVGPIKYKLLSYSFIGGLYFEL